MKSWRDLGVVETIYEEEQEEGTSSGSLSPPLSPHRSLQSRVEEWSQETGKEPNIMVLVQGQFFRLHKEPLVAGSRYLRRHLGASVTVPSAISPETFAAVAASFYGYEVAVTASNVVALRVASELLDVREDGESLRGATEAAFRRLVCGGGAYAEVVLESCLRMMPEAEETAGLASRCMEELWAERGGAGAWTGGVASLRAEEFQVLADSIGGGNARSHDLLYHLLSVYLQGNGGKLSEPEKNLLAGKVECEKLSLEVLRQAVQNPHMPLRFVVQAMLNEHFNTRRSVSAAAAAAGAPVGTGKWDKRQAGVTLGAMLRRDSALRHVAQLRAAMEATSERIRCLESDLVGMKERLVETERCREKGKSESFRFSSEEERRRGAGRDGDSKEKGRIGRRLVAGLKSVIFLAGRRRRAEKDSGEEEAVESRPPSHRRTASFA